MKYDCDYINRWSEVQKARVSVYEIITFIQVINIILIVVNEILDVAFCPSV